MACFFIGPPERQIFANLVEPKRAGSGNKAFLLCYPFGQQYLRAHRSYRQLATLLARAGYAVLRFDYPCTGDSQGSRPLQNFDELCGQLMPVVHELKARTGIHSVYVCGLRFGGLVAAKLAELDESMKGIFLWDSYSSGDSFIEDCRQQSERGADADGTWWIHGFPLTDTFRHSIANFSLSSVKLGQDVSLSQVISHESPDSLLIAESFKDRIKQHIVPSNGDWNYVDRDGSILMPAELIKFLSNTMRDI